MCSRDKVSGEHTKRAGRPERIALGFPALRWRAIQDGLRLRRPIEDVRTVPHDAVSTRNYGESHVGETRTSPHKTATNSPKFGATLGDASERAPGGLFDEPFLTVRGAAPAGLFCDGLLTLPAGRARSPPSLERRPDTRACPGRVPDGCLLPYLADRYYL